MIDRLWLTEVREGDRLIVSHFPIVGQRKDTEAQVTRVTRNYITAGEIRYKKLNGWGAGRHYDRVIISRAS